MLVIKQIMVILSFILMVSCAGTLKSSSIPPEEIQLVSQKQEIEIEQTKFYFYGSVIQPNPIYTKAGDLKGYYLSSTVNQVMIIVEKDMGGTIHLDLIDKCFGYFYKQDHPYYDIIRNVKLVVVNNKEFNENFAPRGITNIFVPYGLKFIFLNEKLLTSGEIKDPKFWYFIYGNLIPDIIQKIEKQMRKKREKII